jgi:chemotaxis response regulator CheB
MSGSIKVAVVDDSAVVRQVLGTRLAQARDVEVVFTACDPLAARQRMAQLGPDVLVLDVEMPKMDGITFLRGMKGMHDAGAGCIAQDEASCVVFGMPMEAIKLGAVHEVMPLDRIAPSILRYGASRDLKTACTA